jgi:hypothetical protein
MTLLVPPLAALLDRAKTPPPVKPVEQVGSGLGAGTGMVAPPRMQYSPKLAELIAARAKALEVANPATPNVSPLEVFARGNR